ncbi:MAG: DUF4364 family protein [Clostridia bacterium]|nr:DUF4364 family protein [Clostridia bacterium]
MNNEINAFDKGVAIGGLRNTTQIKLLIEYLVENAKEPLTRDVAVEALVTHELANYFEASQAVDDLIANQSIVKDRDGLLCITHKGSEALRELIKDLPASVRETAMADATAVQTRRRNEKENTATIVTVDSGYNVVCNIMHKDEILMSVTLYAADFEQAESIKNRFIDDPSALYSTVLSILCK